MYGMCVCVCACLWNVCSNKLAGGVCENAPFAYGYYVGATPDTPSNDTVSLSRRVRPASAGTCFRFGFSHVPCKLPYATSAALATNVTNGQSKENAMAGDGMAMGDGG